MIPIVFAYGGDPAKAELVESFNQPGNVTGVTTINAELGGKWLSLVSSSYTKDQKSQMLA